MPGLGRVFTPHIGQRLPWSCSAFRSDPDPLTVCFHVSTSHLLLRTFVTNLPSVIQHWRVITINSAVSSASSYVIIGRLKKSHTRYTNLFAIRISGHHYVCEWSLPLAPCHKLHPFRTNLSHLWTASVNIPPTLLLLWAC